MHFFLFLIIFVLVFIGSLILCVYNECKNFNEYVQTINENDVNEGEDNMCLFKKKKPYDPFYKGFTSEDDKGKTELDFKMERDIAIAKLGDKEIELSALQKRFDTLYENYIAICNKSFNIKNEKDGDNLKND